MGLPAPDRNAPPAGTVSRRRACGAQAAREPAPRPRAPALRSGGTLRRVRAAAPDAGTINPQGEGTPTTPYYRANPRDPAAAEGSSGVRMRGPERFVPRCSHQPLGDHEVRPRLQMLSPMSSMLSGGVDEVRVQRGWRSRPPSAGRSAAGARRSSSSETCARIPAASGCVTMVMGSHLRVRRPNNPWVSSVEGGRPAPSSLIFPRGERREHLPYLSTARGPAVWASLCTGTAGRRSWPCNL